MTVIKLSKSGKSVLVIDDSGNIFMTALSMLKGIVNNNHKGLVLLSRLPFKTDPHRFKPSPLWNPDNLEVTSSNSGQGFDKKFLKDREEGRGFVDKPLEDL